MLSHVSMPFDGEDSSNHKAAVTLRSTMILRARAGSEANGAAANR